MPRAVIPLSNFSAGELSPKLRGRYDLQFYPNGCERIENFICETQGPARFRNGFRFVLNTKDNQEATLIPFEFNDEQAYILEFTDELMRIYKDGGIVVEDGLAISGITKANPAVVTIAAPAALNITGATNANPCVLTIANHDLVVGDSIQIAAVGGMTQLNGNTYTVDATTTNTVTLNVNSTAYGVYTSGGTAQRLTRHRYSNGDEIFISDVVGMTEVNRGPFTVANKTNSTFELSGVNSTNYTTYVSGGLSKRIVEITSPYAAEDIVELNYAQTADTMFIAHSLYEPRKLTRTDDTAWSFATYTRTSDPFTMAGDYPRAVAFYEQRLVYGGTLNDPQKLWFSVSDNYSDHTTGSNADDAMEYTIASEKANIIRWLAPTEKQLVIGTSGGTFKATGSQTDEAITPSSISIKPSGAFGSAAIAPVRTDNQIIFVQRGQKTVRSYEFDILQDGFVNVDRNLTADHVAERFASVSQISQLALQTGRPDVIWGAKLDGELLGLTYKIKEQVSGWHRHTTRKNIDHGFESVATLPLESGDDQLWVVTKRTIDGQTRRFVEYMDSPVVFPERSDYYTGQDNEEEDQENYLRDLFEAQKQSYHLDAGGTYDSLVTNTTITPGAVSGNSVTFTAGASLFATTDVGREIWAKNKNGRARIISRSSDTVVTCKITVAFDDTDTIPANEWYLTISEISGLEYLEGETVQVVTDGGVHPDCTVENGAIQLDYEASVVHWGFKYEGFLKTMRLETGIGSPNGISQSKPINVSRLGVLFFNTLGASYGTSLYSLEAIDFRSSGDKMNRPAPAFSGFKDVQVSNEWEADKHVIISQRQPLPCVVQLIGAYEETSTP